MNRQTLAVLAGFLLLVGTCAAAPARPNTDDASSLHGILRKLDTVLNQLVNKLEGSSQEQEIVERNEDQQDTTTASTTQQTDPLSTDTEEKSLLSKLRYLLQRLRGSPDGSAQKDHSAEQAQKPQSGKLLQHQAEINYDGSLPEISPEESHLQNFISSMERSYDGPEAELRGELGKRNEGFTSGNPDGPEPEFLPDSYSHLHSRSQSDGSLAELRGKQGSPSYVDEEPQAEAISENQDNFRNPPPNSLSKGDDLSLEQVLRWLQKLRSREHPTRGEHGRE